MSQGQVIDLMREAFFITLLLSGPVLLVGLVTGLIVSIVQTATSIQEQTLTFVPKAITISLILILLGPWMLTNMVDYVSRLFVFIATLGR
jgi:flagellar biosynthetic protein FliQ